MRLWSLHPKYLDAKGLVALWREGLLAQKVLSGKTRGYRNHPQQLRFRECRDPMKMIGIYLLHVAQEAEARGYRFDCSKIFHKTKRVGAKIVIPSGQVRYEIEHLLKKLQVRDIEKFKEVKKSQRILLHPLFMKIRGDVASWERV